MLQVSLYSSIPALTIHILFRLLRWDTRSELALHSGYCTKLTPHPLRHATILYGKLYIDIALHSVHLDIVIGTTVSGVFGDLVINVYSAQCCGNKLNIIRCYGFELMWLII